MADTTDTTIIPKPSSGGILATDHVRLARGMVQVLWREIEAARMAELIGAEELCEAIIFHLEAEMAAPPTKGGPAHG